jgi:hypothetical protein
VTVSKKFKKHTKREMKHLDILVRIFTITSILAYSQESYCQLSKQDSLAITLLKAINITDSINSPLPDSIRIVTIKHFRKVGLEPSDYYTIRDFSVDKRNNLGEIKTYEIRNRQDFQLLDNSNVSEDSQIIAYFQNVKQIEINWIIEYYRIGALRDYCFNTDTLGIVRLGSWGEEMDDILVQYNSDFSKIVNISNAE